MNTTTTTQTVRNVQRIANDTNGNPRFRLTLEGGAKINTAAGRSFVYQYNIVPGRWEITTGGRGTVIDMVPA